MKVRSITLGTAVGQDPEPALADAGVALAGLRRRYVAAGYDVQTQRVCLQPLRDITLLATTPLDEAVFQLGRLAAASGIEYLALGPLRWGERPAEAARLEVGFASALAASDRVFGSIQTTDRDQVDYPAVAAAGRVMRALANSTEQGFGNLRFAALASCPAGIPFFPAAYHDAAEPAFGLALQAADLAVEAFAAVDSLVAAERELTSRVEQVLLDLERIGREAERELGIRYLGADPTLAPFPSDEASIGAAIELLGVGRVGEAGTLSAAALITRALRRAGGRRTGFSGLMLPVLEDSVLARRADEGLLSWEQLLLYSAVCGTGLDTVPLPGDVTAEQLAGIVLDLSALSVALAKPLTCRLLPVPGLKPGQRTSFDFPFFANAAALEPGEGDAGQLLRRGLAASGQ